MRRERQRYRRARAARPPAYDSSEAELARAVSPPPSVAEMWLRDTAEPRLEVRRRSERGPSKRRLMRHAGSRNPDDDLRWAVRVALADDPWLDSSSITVDVRERVAILGGEVNDFLEARYAWDDAWETEGIEGVIDRLKVRSVRRHRD